MNKNTQNKHANMLGQAAEIAQGPIGYGVGGAGIGALLAAALSKKKNRLRNAAIGGTIGAGAGVVGNAALTNKVGYGWENYRAKQGGLFEPKTPVNYNADLHKMLQQWEQTKASPAATRKETFLGPITQGQPSPELVQALNTHMQLPKDLNADELDAMHTLLELDDAAPENNFNDEDRAIFRDLERDLDAGPPKLAALKKQALIGTTIGAVGGALTGDKGKRMRAATRGAVKGLGTDVGMASGGAAGAALGGLGGAIATLPIGMLGAIPGAIGGGLAGGYHGGRLGYHVADSMVGPYKSKREELLELIQELEKERAQTSGENKIAEEKKADAIGALGGAGVYGGLGALAGAPIGGLYGLVSGAYQGGKGKRISGALRGLGRGIVGGGLIGGGAGAGFGGLVGSTLPMGEIMKQTKGLSPSEAAARAAIIGARASESHGPIVHNLIRAGGIAGLGAGGYLGNKAFKGVAGNFHKKPQPQEEDTKMATNKNHRTKASSGAAFHEPDYYRFLAGLTGVGAAGGGLVGALASPKGKMLSHAFRGALRGGSTGLGAGLGAGLAAEIANEGATNEDTAWSIGVPSGAGIGYGLADRAIKEYDHSNAEPAAPKIAALNDYITSPLAQGATMGGLGGAALGGMAGLMAPGHEDTVDEYGRPVRKQRNRFGAAVRGALGGGLAGAAGGAAAGHFAPGQTTGAFNAVGQYGNQALNSVQNYGQQLAQQLGFGGKSLPAAPAQ